MIDTLLMLWSAHPELVAWIHDCRVTGIASGLGRLSEDEARSMLENLHHERERLRALTR